MKLQLKLDNNVEKKGLQGSWRKKIVICPFFILTYTVELGAIISSKLLYLIPGLWNMQESKFWDAFWFEAPFAIFRGMLLLIPVVLNVLYFIFAYTAKRLYRDEKNNS